MKRWLYRAASTLSVVLLGCRVTGAQNSVRIAHPDDATRQVE